MKNIPLSSDAALIEAARTRARAEQTTLDEQLRRWLADYTRTDARLQRYEAVMDELRGTMNAGRWISREDLNER